MYVYVCVCVCVCGEVWVNLLGGQEFTIVAFLLCMNGSGMRSWPYLASQPLTIPAPWVILCVGLPITRLVVPLYLLPVSLRGIRRLI